MAASGGMAQVWVGGLPQDISEDDIEKLFAKCGKVRARWLTKPPLLRLESEMEKPWLPFSNIKFFVKNAEISAEF